jgi:chitinase
VWYLDGVAKRTETTAPFNDCQLSLTAGTHEIKAVATDKKGNKSEAKVSVTAGSTGGTNPAPTVQLMTPSAGTTLNGTGTYQASATDNVAVAKVDVYLISGSTSKLVDSKTAAPYTGTISTAGVPNGPATLRVVATDNQSATAQVDRSVTVQNGTTDPTDPGDPGTPGSGTTVPANGSRGVATFESIGLYWKPGNTPGAAGCTVKYRKHSESAFK